MKIISYYYLYKKIITARFVNLKKKIEMCFVVSYLFHTHFFKIHVFGIAE